MSRSLTIHRLQRSLVDVLEKKKARGVPPARIVPTQLLTGGGGGGSVPAQLLTGGRMRDNRAFASFPIMMLLLGNHMAPCGGDVQCETTGRVSSVVSTTVCRGGCFI